MPNLFTKEIEDKYTGAISDKENSQFKEKIIQSLNDVSIQDNWIKLKTSKSTIKDLSAYNKYIDNLKEFFNTICEKITAPGVDAFMEWLNQFGSLNHKHTDLLRNHLINNYQYTDYAGKIESIINNKSVIDFNQDDQKLFDNLIKLLHKSIKKEIDELINKPELFETTVIPFLEAQSNQLISLSEIEELSFSSVNQLFTEDHIKNNIDYYTDIIEDAVKYLNDVKQNKYVGQESLESDGIGFRITDLRKFINSLNNFGISTETNTTLKSIFDKTKDSIITKQGTLAQRWDEYETKIWTPLSMSHDLIHKFFTDKDDVDLDLLTKGNTKWQLPDIIVDLNFLVEKFKEVSKENPLDIIDKIPSKDLPDTLTKKHQSIVELSNHSQKFKEKLFEVINSRVQDFESNKIPIIENISTTDASIQKQLDTIRANINALKLINTEEYLNKEFLNFLSNDFDSFYGIYESLDSQYTDILSSTGLKDDIGWLNEKLQGSDELELTSDDLKDEARLVKLMGVNLIKITITKNA